ncbi:MAG: hypothetical protein C0478_15595 [Planctomyces sp.]|nr:hypothetical protein [Planctomyces sp.]
MRHPVPVDRGHAGLDLSTGAAAKRPTAVFEIRRDGKSLRRSPVVEADQLLNFEVNITGINQLELTTAPSEDGSNSDWGLWLEPQLAR